LLAVGFALLFTPALLVVASALKYLVGVGFLYDALASVLFPPLVHRLSAPLVWTGAALALAFNVYAVARATRLYDAGPKRRAASFLLIAASALLFTVLITNALPGHAGLL
jgi:hypothetical protein